MHVPSEVDVLGEDEGAHDGHHDHHERAEGRGEDRAPALDHQPLHVVGNARRHDTLHTYIFTDIHGQYHAMFNYCVDLMVLVWPVRLTA